MKIRVNDIELNYEIIGHGEPLIMVHGNGEDYHIFDELSKSLQDKYQIYLVDSRCHGHSECKLPLTYEIMADDLYTFVEYFELKNVSMLGFSDGGIILLWIALKRPKWLKKIVVCGANLSTNGLSKSDLKGLKDAYKRDPNIYLELMINQKPIDQRRLDRLKIESTIIAGEYDLIPKKHTEMIARHLKDSKLYILPQKNHDSYIVHSDELKKFF